MGKPNRGELVQGTLDMLILKTLARGAMHGWGIAQSIQQASEEMIPARPGLRRTSVPSSERYTDASQPPNMNTPSTTPFISPDQLVEDGLLDAEWGQSENNRRAKFYRLSKRGRKALKQETDHWRRLAQAIARVMETA